MNMQEMEQAILKALRGAVLAQLKMMKISEPVYAVILTYGTESGEDLCPWVAAGLQSERALYEKTAPDELYLLLWESEGLVHYDPLEELIEDPDYLELCERWQEGARAAGLLEEKTAALMQRLCFTLMKEDWSGLFPVTEDFVVTACTQEGDWLVENLSILLPKDLYNRFLKKGYILPGCGTDGEEAGE